MQNKNLKRHLKAISIVGIVQIAIMVIVILLTNSYCWQSDDICSYKTSMAEAVANLDRNVHLVLIEGNSVSLTEEMEKDIFSIQENGKDMDTFRSSLQEYLSNPNTVKLELLTEQIHGIKTEAEKREDELDRKANATRSALFFICFALLFGSVYFLILNVLLIRRFSMEEKIKEEMKSCKDSLTGLWNRRFVDQYLKKEVEEKKSGYLFMTDMDFFKQVNDTMGHDKGDEALILTAEAILSVVRKEDRVCRLGGDEYMIYIPGETTEEGARLMVERFRTAMRQKFDPTDMSFVTLSCGATKIDGTCSFEEAYKQADDALRYVKEHGKNGFYITKKAVEKDEK